MGGNGSPSCVLSLHVEKKQVIKDGTSPFVVFGFHMHNDAYNKFPPNIKTPENIRSPAKPLSDLVTQANILVGNPTIFL